VSVLLIHFWTQLFLSTHLHLHQSSEKKWGKM